MPRVSHGFCGAPTSVGRIRAHFVRPPRTRWWNLVAAPERLRWLELLSYIYAFVYHERNRAERARLRNQIEASVRTDVHRREVSAMGKTIAEDLMEKGERRGKKREAVQSRRRILLTLLRKRFGDLPEQMVSAVKSCTNAEVLDSWLERFATAVTLDEVGIHD
jgi:hypothetical protein